MVLKKPIQISFSHLKNSIKSDKNLIHHYERLAINLKLTHLSLYKNRTISELKRFQYICMKGIENYEKIKMT